MAKEKRETLGEALDQPKSLFATLSADGEGVRDELEGSFPTIVGLLSGVFDAFMGPYIGFERRNLDDLISAASRTPSSADDDIDRDRKLPVFSSSVNIFVYIKNSVQRCTKFTTGQTFFDLHEEFKRCLRCERKLAEIAGLFTRVRFVETWIKGENPEIGHVQPWVLGEDGGIQFVFETPTVDRRGKCRGEL